jgi:hypothetical protein
VIEVAMVRRMAVRALFIAPFIVALAALAGGWEYALSAGVGLALTIANLWLAARIIGGVAENSPQLLMVAALGAFALGLMALTGIALALQSADVIFFPVTGFVLVGSHLLLVLWEAAGAHRKVDPPRPQSSRAPVEPRS